MVMKNPVIVMALYDIGRDKWPNFTMSYHTYCWWMRNTLSLDANIVVYTEDKFVDEIRKYRKEFDPEMKKTVIVEIPLTQLYIHKEYYTDISYLMSSVDFKSKIHFKDVPEMCQPLYNIIMFEKVFFLKDCIKEKFFNNDMVIWADAGGLRENIDKYKNYIWPNLTKINNLDNDKITFFTHNMNFNIPTEMREYHSLSQIRNIQGTCFLAPSHLVDQFSSLFLETINEAIQNDYIGSDEKIFDICHTKKPELFNLIKSGWREYFDILI